jgi:hypothetical protein
MLAIILVLVGVALAGLLVYGNSTSLQNSSPVRSQIKENTITAIYGLASAYQAYYNANGVAPTAGACSSTALVPTYITEIKYPASGLSCSFGTNATYGNYFCYSGSVSQQAYNAFVDATASFPTSSYILGTTGCAERTTDTAPTTWPATIYLTYWLLGQ